MTMLSVMIYKEQQRNQKMIMEYEKELSMLPKGSISTKVIKNRCYYYLTYRDKRKIISKYIGKDMDLIQDIKEKLLRRKQVKNIIKKLKVEQEQIKKVEDIL